MAEKKTAKTAKATKVTKTTGTTKVSTTKKATTKSPSKAKTSTKPAKTVKEKKKNSEIKPAKIEEPVIVKETIEPVQKEVKTPKKKKNVAIEFWRIFFAIAIIGYHVGTIMSKTTATGVDGYWMSASNWWAGAGEILFVFTLTAGYFMVSHFKRLQKDEEYSKKSAMARAGEYLLARIKNLLPVLIFGYAFGLIISKFYFGYEWMDIINISINGLWEFLGLHAAGLRGATSIMVGNGALWFISAMFICSYFLYWGLCKNEDKTSGLFAPFIFVFLGGWWCFTGTRASQMGWSGLGAQITASTGVTGSVQAGTGILGFNNGFLFVLLGMCGGMILYYIVEKIKKHKFKALGLSLLTFLYVVVAGLLIWYTVYPDTTFHLERWTVHLLCFVLVGLTLLGVDGITKVLNNNFTHKILEFLGGMALYLYMIHYPVILLVLMIAGKNNIGTMYTAEQVLWPTLLLSFILGILVKIIMDSTFMSKKEN